MFCLLNKSIEKCKDKETAFKSSVYNHQCKQSVNKLQFFSFTPPEHKDHDDDDDED